MILQTGDYSRRIHQNHSHMFSHDAAPVPAVLCLCESSISDTMGMLCRFLCLQYGAVHSRGYLGQEHGNERHDREQTVFGVFHCGGCYITSDFFCGCSVWIYPETILAVSLLRTSISILCSDKRG